MSALKNSLRIITSGISGPAQMLIYTLLILLIALVVFINATTAAGHPHRNITPLLTVLSGFLWFLMGSGCLLTAHHAYQLRLAGVGRQVARIMVAIYALASVLPALLSISATKVVAINTAVAAGMLLCLMLPPQVLMFAGFLPMLRISRIPGLAQLLPVDAARPLTYWYIATPLLIAAYLRWRVIRRQACTLQRNVALLSALRSDVNISFSNPSGLQRQQLPWLSPKAGKANARTMISRLRTLLGMLFAPGSWQRQALFCFAAFGVLRLWTAMLIHSRPLSSASTPMPGLPFFSDSLLLMMTFFVPLSIGFSIQPLLRPQSHDLAELALLPGLPAHDKTRWLRRAMAQTCALYGIGIAASLSLLMIMFQQLTPAKALILVCAIPLSTLLSVTQLLHAMVEQSKHPILTRLLWMLAGGVPGAGAVFLTVHGVLDPESFNAVFDITLLAACTIACLLLSTHWYRQLAARPHPYLAVES